MDEIYAEVADIMQLPEEILNTPHDPRTGGRTKVEYRLAWARNYLKHYGLLENSERLLQRGRPFPQSVPPL